MKKSDIKTGMLVQTRNGDWFLAQIDTVPHFKQTSFLIDINSGGNLALNSYLDTLEHCDNIYCSEYDIVKIAKVPYIGDIFPKLTTGEQLENFIGIEILWERQADTEDKLLESLCLEMEELIKTARTKLQATNGRDE